MSQHLEALRLANAAKLEQSALRRDVTRRGYRRGLLEVAGMLQRGDSRIERIRLEYLLASIDKVRVTRSNQVVDAAGVGRHRLRARCGELTKRERQALARELTIAGLRKRRVRA